MAPLATVGRHQERRLGTPSARSAGWPAIGVDVTIAGPDATPVPSGETGEITVTGPNIMLGYWGKPEVTAEVLAGDSYRSGDLGYLDGDGLLYIVDRKKDMIISGGENVFSVEIEDVLSSHPDVVEAAVLGEPDERWGEVVTAVIVRRNDEVTQEELDRFCHDHLAGYKCPRRYTFRQDPLPRTAAGKLLKRTLRSLTSGEGQGARDEHRTPSPTRPA
jgi:long-chain acyl-CoA synthetase